MLVKNSEGMELGKYNRIFGGGKLSQEEMNLIETE